MNACHPLALARRRFTVAGAIAALSAGWGDISTGQPRPSAPDSEPPMVTDTHFQELFANSPFTRSLNLSDSLILTGIARIGEQTVATLLDKETKASYVISESPNSLGWRLHGVEGNQGDLEQVTVRVAVQGGEVVAVRFSEFQIKPGESRPASGSGSGGGGSAPSARPAEAPPSSRSAEIVWRMEKLSESQRRDLFNRMEQMRRSNPNISSDQARDWFRAELQKLTGSGN